MKVNEALGPLSHWTFVMQIGQLEGGPREATEALRIGAGVFALILFALSLYAWSKRKQPALVIVSLAFLLFFVSHVIELVSDAYEYNPFSQVITAFMNFVILALFFTAIVVRPKRGPQNRQNSKVT